MADAAAVRGRIEELINSKRQIQIVGNRGSLNWKQVELKIVSQCADDALLNIILSFEQECVRSKIPSFYSYFILQKIVKKPDSLSELQREIVQIQQSKSKYQSIKSYIKMREHLLSKINQFTGSSIKNLFEDIEDIRFLNFEIVTGIVNWKKSWGIAEGIEPVFYEEGVNYLLKISNDNADMINLANFKKTKFISPPNPFFLSEDGNLQGMSQKQKENISECMEVITRERTIDLKMIVQGGHFTGKALGKPQHNGRRFTSKPQKLQSSLIRQAKDEMSSLKQQQIKKIYKINKSLSQAKRKIHSQKQEQQLRLRKLSHQQKKMEKQEVDNSSKVVERKRSAGKMVKRQSSVDRIKTRSDIDKLTIERKQMPKQQNLDKKVASKIREEVDKRLNSVGSSEIKKHAVPLRMREIKPKIKLVQQKQTAIDNVKGGLVVSHAYASERPISRKNTSFYKTIFPIIEEADDQNSQIKPVTQVRHGKSSTQLNFNLKKSSIVSIVAEKAIKQSKVRKTDQKYQSKELVDLNKSKMQQISNLRSSLKNLTIINIYKGKKRSSRRERSVSAQEQPQILPRRNVSSFITEISPLEGEDLNYQSANQTKIKKKYELQEERLKKQLSLHLTKNQIANGVLQEREGRRKDAEVQLQQKNELIAELERKIKIIDGKKPSKLADKKQGNFDAQRLFEREKKKSEIEAKILKDHLRKQEERFVANRKVQLKLKQQQLASQFNRNLKQLKMQNQKKQKGYHQLLAVQRRRSKQAELLIKKEENRVKTVELELAQRVMKEELLRKMVEKKTESERESRQESQQQMGQRLDRQLTERQFLQKEGLALIELQKERISALYLELKQKNQRIELQNEKKQKELMQMNEQRQLQRQDLTKMQPQPSLQTPIEKQQQRIAEDAADLENLKLKIKQELLTELLQRQEQEEREEQIEQEKRTKRLKKIEEEVANALRQEEEQLDRENSQFLKRVEAMKERCAIAANLQVTSSLNLAESALQEEKGRQQGQDATQRQQEFSRKSRLQHQKGQAERLVEGEGVKQQRMSASDLKSELPAQQRAEQQAERRQQEKTEMLFREDQELSQNKTIHPVTMQIQTHNLSAQLQEGLFPIVQTQNKSLEEKQAYNQLLMLEANQIQSKYNHLKRYFRKTKQLSAKDLNVSAFLDNFYARLEKYVKEMLPWNRAQLQQRIVLKQIDIFDCNSLGWLEQNNTYNLLGGIECMQNIVRKYRSVEIHQVFHFNRNNAYQKQVLAKKIKFFQNIGYVYQKKIPESNNFSIRFVIKIPKAIGQSGQKITQENGIVQQN